MTAERWQQIESLFHAALERDEQARSAFLDEACAGDAELRAQVEALLASLAEAGDFIEASPVADALAKQPATNADAGGSLIGRRISHYEIQALLGAGGMGEVYLAHDLQLDRQVALKLLPAQFTQDAVQVQRFEREARAASALNHPNIITIHEVGREEDTHFIATEFVAGQTLREKISHGKIELREALRIATQIASALAAAHAAGIVHRDIKPENVMVRPDGLVKVLDFGLAKPIQAERVSGNLQKPSAVSLQTDPRMLMGTLAYLAPEQARGEKVDHRTDIFSLGVVLYEMLTRTRPFTGASAAAILEAILHQPPTPLPDEMPAELEGSIACALAKDREARYPNADELRHDLQRLERKLEATPAITAGFTARPLLARWVGQRSRTMKATVVVAGLAVLVAVLFPRSPEAEKQDALSPWSNAISKQLTAYAGEEINPSLAPDAQYFVYVRQLDGDWDICRQRVGETGFVNLTAAFSADDTQPAYSPDGARLAFRSERDGGGIFLMDADGGNVSKVASEGYNPTWSPDGSEVLYSTANSLSPFVRTTVGGLLGAINPATGEKRRIPTGDALHPHWSPHGARIAYWGKHEGQYDIWTIPAQGGAPVAVTQDEATDWNPVWAPDGKHLYFGSNRSGGVSIWRVPIDEASGRVLGAPEVVTGPSADSRQPAFSRDGRQMAYVQVLIRENLHYIGFDPVKEAVVGQPIPITQGTRRTAAPDLSPDGEWLAYGAFGSTPEDLFLVKSDGSEHRHLTNDKCKDRGPNWAPDGKQVAFYSDCSGELEIWTVDVASGERRQITFNSVKGAINPVWSPDGKQLVYHHRGHNTFIIAADKKWHEQTPRALPPLGADARWFNPSAWSADGRTLAGVMRKADGDAQGIFTYSLATQQYQQLTEGGTSPVWLSDSRRLFFNHQGDVYLVDVQTKRPRKTLSLDPASIAVAGLSHGERRLYFDLRLSETDIRLLTLH